MRSCAAWFGASKIGEVDFSRNLELNYPGFVGIGLQKALANNDAGDGGFVADAHNSMAGRFSSFFNPTPKDLTSWPKSLAGMETYPQSEKSK